MFPGSWFRTVRARFRWTRIRPSAKALRRSAWPMGIAREIEFLESRQLLAATPVAIGGIVDFESVAARLFPGQSDVVSTPDGGMLVATGVYNPHAGASQPVTPIMQIARYNANGTLDAGFGTGGYVALAPAAFGSGFSLDGNPNQIQFLPNGQFLLAGSDTRFLPAGEQVALVVARFNANGSLDPTFGNAGVAQVELAGAIGWDNLTLLNDGSLLFGLNSSSLGQTTFSTGPVTTELVKLTASGALDASFGVNGVATIENDQYNGGISILAAAGQPDGSLFVIASAETINVSHSLGMPSVQTTHSILFWRLTTTGALDTSFGSNGFVDYGLGTYTNTGVLAPVVTPGMASNSADTYQIPIQAIVNSGRFDVLTQFLPQQTYPAATPISPAPINAVLQFHFNGTLDTSFAASGERDLTNAFVAIGFRVDISTISATANGGILLGGGDDAVYPSTGGPEQAGPLFIGLGNSLAISLDATGNLDRSRGGATQFLFVGTMTAFAPGPAGLFYGIALNAFGGVNMFSVQPAYAGTANMTVDAAFIELYNPHAGQTVYTTSPDEANGLMALGYHAASSSFDVNTYGSAGTSPIHRLYDPNNGVHYYTTSDGERDLLVAHGWKFECDAGAIFTTPQPNSQEVYHLYNTQTGTHIFTTDITRVDALLNLDGSLWVQQTSLGYVIGAAAGNAAASQQAAASAAEFASPPAAATPAPLPAAAGSLAIGMAPGVSVTAGPAAGSSGGAAPVAARQPLAPTGALAAGQGHAGSVTTDVLDQFWSSPAIAAVL